MKLSALTSVIAVLGVLSACQTSKPPIEYRPLTTHADAQLRSTSMGYFDQGRAHLIGGDYNLAVAAFHQDMSVHGARVETLNGLAAAYDGLGQRHMAERYLAHARRLADRAPTPGVALDALPRSAYTLQAFAASRPDDERQREPQSAPSPAAPQPGAQLTQRVSNPAVARAAPSGARLAKTGAHTWSLTVPGPAPRTDQPKRAMFGMPFPLGLGAAPTPAPTPASTSTPSAPHAATPVATPTAVSTPTPTPMPTPTLRQGDTEYSTPQPLAVLLRGGAAAALSDTSIRVVNGNGRPGMASRFAGYLSDHQIQVAQLANADRFNVTATLIEYRVGHKQDANFLAAMLAQPAILAEQPTARADLVITLGHDVVDAGPDFGGPGLRGATWLATGALRS